MCFSPALNQVYHYVMDSSTLEIMLCREGFTPDDAQNIIRSDFRRALRIYHAAKNHDKQYARKVYATREAELKTLSEAYCMKHGPEHRCSNCVQRV